MDKINDGLMEYMVKQTSRWCDELDEIVQCPVCYEKPKGKIVLCTQGHHVCGLCLEKIRENGTLQCPTCKQEINNTRSFFTENVLSKIEDIKKTLVQHINADFSKNQLISTATQYSEEDFCLKSWTKLDAAKGLFPCRIDDCTREEPHCRMLEHIKYSHPDNLQNLTSVTGESFIHTWNFDVSLRKNFSTALHVANMELFFLNLEIDCENNLRGSVQILNTMNIAKMFKYVLLVKGHNHTCKYEGPVKTRRADKYSKHEDNLYVDEKKLYYLMRDSGRFDCELSITRTAIENKASRPRNKRKLPN